MQQLTKTNTLLNYSDENYKFAVNYSGSMYNFPITLNYGEKHNRCKYILSAGTSDHITILQDGIFIYVINENSGLNYIGLQVINTELKEEEYTVYLDSNDIDTEENFCFGILDMDTEEQLKILLQYT